MQTGQGALLQGIAIGLGCGFWTAVVMRRVRKTTGAGQYERSFENANQGD